MPDSIDTPRLLLRRWTEDDADDLFDIASDPSVGETAGWRPHSSIQDSRDAISDWGSRPGVYAIVSRSYGRPVGCIEIDTDPKILRKGPKDAEVGFWIGRRYWGQGFATEALSELLDAAFGCGVSKVWCQCLEDNVASVRVLEKCGMVFHHRSVSANEFTGEVVTRFYAGKKNG